MYNNTVNMRIMKNTPPTILSKLLFLMNFSKPSKNLLNKTIILSNLRSRRYLKRLIPGITTGKITSNGIDAINDKMLSFCFKNSVLGVEM